MFQGLDWDHFFNSGLVFSTKPGHIVLSWGPVTESSSPLNRQNFWSFFCPDFYLKKPKYLSFKYNIECSFSCFFKHLNLSLDQKPESRFSDLDFLFFKKQFIQIQNQIQKKTITKAVPLLQQNAKQSFNLQEKKYLLKCLLNPNNQAAKQNLNIYALFLKDNSILGASPEILFSYSSKNKILKSMALAGTDLITAKKNSLLCSDKDIEEHKIVAKYLHKTLSDMGDKQSLTESLTYELETGHLKHLCKDFTVALSNFNLEKTIKTLHPTPALGTAPQSQWKFLKTLDLGLNKTNDRLQYGAPFVGIFPNGDIKAIVAIRNIQWINTETDTETNTETDTDLYLFAGCGIIAKSNLQKEFKELNHKIESVKILLGL